MRERLRRSDRPDRIFEVVVDAARAARMVGRKRVLDSTPLYDAVATMDTITLIRSGIRNLFKVATGSLVGELRSVLTSGDDYVSSSKPTIEWDDVVAREALVDSRAKDAYACLLVLEGKELTPELSEAARLLATVVGQDLEQHDNGTFHIARRVTKDRVISIVDPEARGEHKTSAHSFDGYKGHIALDPDTEVITATVVTPGNAGDASVAKELIADLLTQEPSTIPSAEPTSGLEPKLEDESSSSPDAGDNRDATVYGDAAYGTGEFQSHPQKTNIASKCKTQPPSAKDGLFTKDRFVIDLEANTVRCPGEVTVTIARLKDGSGIAKFARNCASCALAKECTTSRIGRKIRIGLNEVALTRARQEQRSPVWKEGYRKTRPKVERKLAHLMRRRHEGRRARMRGRLRVDADFSLLCAATNLARLAKFEVRSIPYGGWAMAQ
ncbi:MAG: transposase [Ferrimicrobium sp.]